MGLALPIGLCVMLYGCITIILYQNNEQMDLEHPLYVVYSWPDSMGSVVERGVIGRI